MLFEILKNLGKSSVTHILLAEEQTMKNQNIENIDKIEIRENKSSRKIHR